jgi:hypothetical protein
VQCILSSILCPSIFREILKYGAISINSMARPYWKVRMLRQRSLACRNYTCAKIWRIISLKIWMFSFWRGMTAWMTHMYHILGQLELERMKSWNSRTHVNEKFSRYNIYMFH